MNTEQQRSEYRDQGQECETVLASLQDTAQAAEGRHSGTDGHSKEWESTGPSAAAVNRSCVDHAVWRMLMGFVQKLLDRLLAPPALFLGLAAAQSSKAAVATGASVSEAAAKVWEEKRRIRQEYREGLQHRSAQAAQEGDKGAYQAALSDELASKMAPVMRELSQAVHGVDRTSRRSSLLQDSSQQIRHDGTTSSKLSRSEMLAEAEQESQADVFAKPKDMKKEEHYLAFHTLKAISDKVKEGEFPELAGRKAVVGNTLPPSVAAALKMLLQPFVVVDLSDCFPTSFGA